MFFPSRARRAAVSGRVQKISNYFWGPAPAAPIHLAQRLTGIRAISGNRHNALQGRRLSRPTVAARHGQRISYPMRTLAVLCTVVPTSSIHILEAKSNTRINGQRNPEKSITHSQITTPENQWNAMQYQGLVNTYSTLRS